MQIYKVEKMWKITKQFQAQFGNYSTHVETVGWAQIFVFHTYLAVFTQVKGQTNMFHVIIASIIGSPKCCRIWT